ncbi:hypothetical protein RNJ44_04153 [Nakaseomyces bracarensis]|uniref:Uncharacterized protein n=1 Tax=Nakaseomyces bracarensis TaxID=273131 RepID=A0ABR4NU29_9SACH
MEVVELTKEFSKLNGVKDQAITKPIALDGSTGEVVVRTSNGKNKVRKGQTDEEYQEQLQKYFEEEKGPQVTEVGWMAKYSENPEEIFAAESLFRDLSIKHNRQTVSGICHRMYYKRQYQECQSLCQRLRVLYEPYNTKNKIHRELEELDYMIEKCAEHKLK